MRGSLLLSLALSTTSVTAVAEPPVPAPSPAAAPEPPLALHVGQTGVPWSGCPEFFPEGCRLAVLHGDPSKPNADAFFRVPGGARIVSHWHSSAERMVLVEGRLRVQYQGHAAAVLQPGTYAYGPPKLSHWAVCESTTPCTLFIAFEGPVDAVAD